MLPSISSRLCILGIVVLTHAAPVLLQPRRLQTLLETIYIRRLIVYLLTVPMALGPYMVFAGPPGAPMTTVPACLACVVLRLLKSGLKPWLVFVNILIGMFLVSPMVLGQSA